MHQPFCEGRKAISDYLIVTWQSPLLKKVKKTSFRGNFRRERSSTIGWKVGSQGGGTRIRCQGDTGLPLLGRPPYLTTHLPCWSPLHPSPTSPAQTGYPLAHRKHSSRALNAYYRISPWYKAGSREVVLGGGGREGSLKGAPPPHLLLKPGEQYHSDPELR